MAKKRVSRSRKRDLEQPDEFITFWSQLFKFASEKKVLLSSILGLIAMLIIVVSGIAYYFKKSEDQAFTLLQQAMSNYQTIAESNGPQKAYLEIGKDFPPILEKYSSRNGGKLARFVYANMCYQAGDYDKAIDLYNQSLVDFQNEPFLKDFVLNSLGYSHKGKKDYKTAAKFFEMVASETYTAVKDEALFNLGGLYARMGNDDKSKNAFKKILSDHMDSMYIEIVKEKVKE